MKRKYFNSSSKMFLYFPQLLCSLLTISWTAEILKVLFLGIPAGYDLYKMRVEILVRISDCPLCNSSRKWNICIHIKKKNHISTTCNKNAARKKLCKHRVVCKQRLHVSLVWTTQWKYHAKNSKQDKIMEQVHPNSSYQEISINHISMLQVSSQSQCLVIHQVITQ